MLIDPADKPIMYSYKSVHKGREKTKDSAPPTRRHIYLPS